MLERNPRIVWRIGLGLLGVWVAAGALGYRWVKGRAVAGGGVALPEVETPVAHGASPQEDSIEAYSIIWRRPLRSELRTGSQGGPARPPVQKRPIGLALVGTAVEGNESYAFLRDKAGNVVTAKLGSGVGSFVVVGVRPDRVSLDRDGIRTGLTLPESMQKMVRSSGAVEGENEASALYGESGAVHGTGLRPPARRAGPIDLQCSVKEFLNQVRLVPCIGVSGGQVGVRIDSLDPGGSLSRSGLAAGDVIVKVDGTDLTQVSDLKRLCLSLEDGKEHTWDVRREDVALEVRILRAKESQDEVR